MRHFKIAALVAAFALPALPALAEGPAALKMFKTAKGEVLADANDMTLYVFDNDKPGVSNCYDNCAKNWPPVAAAAGAGAEGDFSLVARKDGSQQWAYKGQPLYTWIKDTKPGDTTGDGVNGVWHLARP